LDFITGFFKDPVLIEAIVAVGTQMIAFLLFVWVLKKFAWKPFLEILDERQERIKSKFKDIEALEKSHIVIRNEYQKKLDDVEHIINQKIQEGVNEGKRLAGDIVRRARNDARKAIEQNKAHMEIQVKKAQNDLKQRLTDIVINSTEKLIQIKMNEKHHKDLISSIIDEVECKK
jgi:F-type H+-transporting ATPase subunit b